jgi:hypothetical protein
MIGQYNQMQSNAIKLIRGAGWLSEGDMESTRGSQGDFRVVVGMVMQSNVIKAGISGK